MKILDIKDGNGCISEDSSSNSAVRFSIAEEASIVPADPRIDHCVGERVGFYLQGMPSWTVEYEFQGKRRKAKASNRYFTRIADSAGVLSIVSVADDASHCRVSVRGIEKRIHSLPAAWLDYSNSVEDIHQGDQADLVFKFSGTPPFSLTYARMITDKWSKKEVIAETHRVHGIDGFVYRTAVSQSGIYRVLSVSDKFCR